jgi:zinc transport system ATP-binding protein
VAAAAVRAYVPGVMPALEVEHLSLAFGRNEVLKDLSFRVASGSTLAIIGPNGAGKTALFQALIGAVPHGGTVRWAPGTRLGYVPQKLDIERDLPLTGRDFLGARAAVARVDRSEIARVLDLVALPPAAAERPIGALSGGQFQRLLLGFALLGRPTVLLFDEPTAGVDEPGEVRLYEMIHALQQERGMTLLLISHELSLVSRYADRVLCLGHEPPWQGPPEEVLTPEILAEVYGAPLKYHRHA